jgi:general secretion pathway protein M
MSAAQLKGQFDAWFKTLQPRERLLVSSAAIVLIGAVLFLGVFAPLGKAVASRQTRVDTKKLDLVWMRGAANSVRMAAAQTGGNVSGESLVVLINRTAQPAGLASALVNQSPAGDNSIRVRLERGSFDSIVTWLGSLQQQYSVRVDNASIDRADKPGIVNASLVLTRTP